MYPADILCVNSYQTNRFNFIDFLWKFVWKYIPAPGNLMLGWKHSISRRNFYLFFTFPCVIWFGWHPSISGDDDAVHYAAGLDKSYADLGQPMHKHPFLGMSTSVQREKNIQFGTYTSREYSRRWCNTPPIRDRGFSPDFCRDYSLAFFSGDNCNSLHFSFRIGFILY